MIELISIHIGKTAGTAFRGVLSRAYQEENVLWDYPPYPYQPPASLPDNIRAIHGHVSIHKYLGHFTDAKRIVWLRHPLFRIISEYYFARQYKDRENPLHVELVDQDLSFLQFIELPAAQNIMATQIIGLDLKQFAFVGLQEFYDEDLSQLEQQMGWKSQPRLIENVNPDPDYYSSLRKILNDSDLVAQVIALNLDDMLLYQEALDLRARRTNSSVLLQETLAGWNRAKILFMQPELVKQELSKLSPGSLEFREV